MRRERQQNDPECHQKLGALDAEETWGCQFYRGSRYFHEEGLLYATIRPSGFVHYFLFHI